jgi:hypothetical protein
VDRAASCGSAATEASSFTGSSSRATELDWMSASVSGTLVSGRDVGGVGLSLTMGVPAWNVAVSLHTSEVG